MTLKLLNMPSTTSEKKRPRGGRSAKIRLALDLCKQAHRRGDVETKKSALEMVCMCYDVNPTQLTSQGIKGMSIPGCDETQSSTAASLTPPPTPTAQAPPAQNNFEPPVQADYLEPVLMEETAPVEAKSTSITDPQTLDILLDIERFIAGDQPQ